MKTLFLTLIGLAFLSGCSVLNTVAEEDNRLLVQYATLKVIETDDNVTGPGVVSLIERAKQYASGESVTVSALVDAGRARLADSGLSAADKLLVNSILAEAQRRLEARLGGGVLNEEAQFKLITVLGWVQDAAAAYK